MAESKESIENVVVSVLRSKLFVPEKMCSVDYWNEPLTGELYKFSAVDLAYLMFELEKVYSIKINADLLKAHGFYSISAIVETIKLHVLTD